MEAKKVRQVWATKDGSTVEITELPGPDFDHPGDVRVASDTLAFSGWLPQELLVSLQQDVFPGKLIVIEGPDGSGKTTLVESLALEISKVREIISLREPGGCALSEEIRLILKDPTRIIGDRAEALLFAACRAQLIDEIIRPALQQGMVVLLDRHVDSSVIYQGIGRGLGQDNIKQLSDFSTQEVKPDRIVVLKVSAETAQARMNLRDGIDGADRIEAGLSMDEIRAGYEALAHLNDGVHVVVDANQTPEQVLQDTYSVVADLL